MKVLSIDFDWVMEPFIQAYNQYSRANKSGPDETWKIIEAEIPALKYNCNFEMDYEKYANLYFFLREVCKHNPKSYILIGQNHNEIIPAIKKVHHEIGGPLEIINIDHHHDRGYHHNDIEEFKERPYDCTNWLHYLTKYYQVNKYIWVRNKNSEMQLCHELPKNHEYITLTDLKDLNTNDHYDLIFICSSYDWVPLKYRPLFNILVDNPGKLGLQ